MRGGAGKAGRDAHAADGCAPPSASSLGALTAACSRVEASGSAEGQPTGGPRALESACTAAPAHASALTTHKCLLLTGSAACACRSHSGVDCCCSAAVRATLAASSSVSSMRDIVKAAGSERQVCGGLQQDGLEPYSWPAVVHPQHGFRLPRSFRSKALEQATAPQGAATRPRSRSRAPPGPGCRCLPPPAAA